MRQVGDAVRGMVAAGCESGGVACVGQGAWRLYTFEASICLRAELCNGAHPCDEFQAPDAGCRFGAYSTHELTHELTYEPTPTTRTWTSTSPRSAAAARRPTDGARPR